MQIVEAESDVTNWHADPEYPFWYRDSFAGSYLAPTEMVVLTFKTPPVPILDVTATAPVAARIPSIAEGPAKGPGPAPKVVITVIDPATGLQVPVDADKGLKVAKWHDAFKLTADGKSVEIKRPDVGTNWDFIDRDRDRFNVWVYDPTTWSEMTNGQPTNPRVQAKISTANVAGFTAYNDAATAVDLVRVPSGTAKGDGWYWSDSQMLVSNKVDDELKVDLIGTGPGYLGQDEQPPAGDALGPKNGYTWKLSDRTHRIAPGGTVKAEYTSVRGLTAKPAEGPVKVVGTVKVHVTILNSGGNAVVAKADAEKYVNGANEQYAQVGIRLVPTVSDPANPPQGVNLSNGLQHYTWPSGAAAMTMTQEEKNLLGHTAFRTEATDDIEVYYVNYFANANDNPENGLFGESFPPSGVPNSIYADSAIVSSPTPFGIPLQWPQQVVAHEIGHVLLDSGLHYDDATKWANLMVSPPQWMVDPNNLLGQRIDDVTASKRLTEQQEAIMINWGY